MKKLKEKFAPIGLDTLFEDKNGIEIQLNKTQCFERILQFILFLLMLFLFYQLFKWVGNYLASNADTKVFNAEYLYSIFLIPLFFYVKDYQDMFDSCFTKAFYCKDYITVKRGLFYSHYDKLYFRDLNNIELYRSFGGKVLGYCQISFYAVGGLLILPYVMDNDSNKKILEELMQRVQENQCKDKN